MSDTILQSRREKICMHLLENGGELTMTALGEWCGLKLLVSHQPLSELLEGMVEDGLLRWDGTSFSLHSEGRALAEKTKAAGGGKKGKKKAADVPAEPSGEATAEAVAVVAADAATTVAPPAPVAPPEADQGHDHGHSHGHSHAHDREGSGEEQELPPPPRKKASPPPSAAPAADGKTCTKPKGILGRIKCRIKKLLGR